MSANNQKHVHIKTLRMSLVIYSYPRTHIIRDGPFAGSDRHNGEIVAFHLAGLLGMHRTPIVAGRRISLDEIRGKSTPALNTTFYKEGTHVYVVYFYALHIYFRSRSK